MNIEFSCAKCGANLKVRAAFGGHSVQCPKCGKKTDVPKAGENMAQSAGQVAVPSTNHAVADAGLKTEEPSLPIPDMSMYDKQISTMAKKIREMEAQLEVAKLRAEQSEKARQEALKEKKTEREQIECEISGHYQAEIEAARASVAELKARLSQEYRKRIELQAEEGNRTCAEIERDLLASGVPEIDGENIVDPDALISEITTLPFGKYLRIAVALHVCFILLTSIGYFFRLAKAKPEEDESAEATPAGAVSDSAKTNKSKITEKPEDQAPEAEQGLSKETGKDTKKEPTAGPDRKEKTKIEQSIESLPKEGETPPSNTSVSLDKDL